MCTFARVVGVAHRDDKKHKSFSVHGGIKRLPTTNFFGKITCKPMDNFAENLNLCKHVHPHGWTCSLMPLVISLLLKDMIL